MAFDQYEYGVTSANSQGVLVHYKKPTKWATTLSDIIKKIQSTAQQRLKIKRMAVSLSLEYCTKLALAKEEAGEVKAAVYICSFNIIEQERKLFQNIQIMENRIKGGSTSKVIITAADGNIQEFTDKNQWKKY